jgi:hypothetical protein
LQNESGAHQFAPRFFLLLDNSSQRAAAKMNKGAAKISQRPEKHLHRLMAIVVVIVVIPIVVAVPTVAVFVPPTMSFVPAAFTRLVQFVPRAIRLPAVPAVVFHGFMQFVVRLGDAPLAIAIVVVIRPRTRRSGKNHQAGKRRSSEHGLSEKLLPSRLKFHVLSILPYSPSGMGWGPTL